MSTTRKPNLYVVRDDDASARTIVLPAIHMGPGDRAADAGLAGSAPAVHDEPMTQQVLPPPTSSPPTAGHASFVERVKAAVRAASLADRRILVAAISPDGTSFSLHGATRETEMYDVGAAVQDAAIAAVDPSGDTYLDGGWTRAPYPREGWIIVLSRSQK